MLQSRASELFAVDIHPGAQIGNGVMLDHGTGVVIGGTAVLGNDLYILHQAPLARTPNPHLLIRHRRPPRADRVWSEGEGTLCTSRTPALSKGAARAAGCKSAAAALHR